MPLEPDHHSHIFIETMLRKALHRQVRKKHMAAAIGVDPSSFSRIASGRRPITLDQAKILAKMLDIDLNSPDGPIHRH